ncbi:MAG: hypothetical protein JNL21_24535 [Myxococcales bacterium]|nr:hypothetical protein [Myxococcales bacterium]
MIHARLFSGPAAALLFLLGCGDSSEGTGSGGGTTVSAGQTTATSTTSGSSTGSSPTSSATTGSGGAPPSCDFTETPGTTTETLDVDGTMRTYVLVVPDDVDGKSAVPLVFGFHGFNGTADAASQYFGLSGQGAYYVYPQALPLPGQNGGVGWDMEPDGVDVAFIDSLITSLVSSHCIDEARVFAAGHSHGASFSNHLGCYRPEVFRAVAPVAGGGPWAGPCTGSVSAMLVHGSADDQVPVSAGQDSRDHWLMANGCLGSASAPIDPAPCAVYDGCAEPVLWCEHGGGHEWPDFAGAGIRGFFLGL